MRLLTCCLLAIGTSLLSYSQIDPSRIRIARDSFGVPHIFAPTDPEVAYGLAWAHAEDDFRSLQEVVWPAKGLMGRALGKQGAAGDFAFALLRCRETTRERWHTLSPAFLALAKGYVQGINDYARSHPDQVVVKGTFPITVEDYVSAAVLAVAIFNGMERALGQVFNNQAPTANFADEGKKGSNAFAIHQSKSAEGENMLVINAHQPNTGPQAFYEAHVCSDAGWNAMGGLLAGGPCILHGVNEHLGWAHTVNYADRLDVYQLQMHPRKKGWYKLDGQWEKLEMRKVKLRIKGIPVPVSRKVYWSKYGATMRNKQGFFSFRLGGNMRIGALDQWYQMNRATNFTEFYGVLQKQELSMFNILYADRYDTIFYINNALMPIRQPGFNWKGTLPGNTSKTLWTDFRPLKALPQYVNPGSGILFNTNHSPFFASGKADNLSPEAFAAADGWETYMNNRSARVYELMPAGKLSFDQLKAIKFDKQLPSTLQFPIQIDTMYSLKAAEYPELAEVITTFQQWDRRAVPESKGAACFLLTYRKLERTAPRRLSKAESVEVFTHIRDYQQRYFGRTGITLGELQQLVRGTNSFPMYGMPDVLTAEWGVQQPNGTIRVTGGDGLVIFARFPKNSLPYLETMNMYGASANPASPHFADQVPLYLQQQTKRMTLDKQEVLRKAVRVYSPAPVSR